MGIVNPRLCFHFDSAVLLNSNIKKVFRMKSRSLIAYCSFIFASVLASPVLVAAEHRLSDLSSDKIGEIADKLPKGRVYNTFPAIKDLTSFEGDENDCFETQLSGTVCTSDSALFIDDAHLLRGKERRWRIRTGIGVIDNNANVLTGALVGGAAAGVSGSVAGAFWVDKTAAQAKINELRSQNKQLQAQVAQAKVDAIARGEAAAAEKDALVRGNSCLAGKDSLLTSALQGISGFKSSFETCLINISENDPDGGDKAQTCLDQYSNNMDQTLKLVLTLGQCG